jgi:hypothetical protein
VTVERVEKRGEVTLEQGRIVLVKPYQRTAQMHAVSSDVREDVKFGN